LVFTTTSNSAADTYVDTIAGITTSEDLWVIKGALDGTRTFFKNDIANALTATNSGTASFATTSIARMITLGSSTTTEGFVGEISDFVLWTGAATDAEI
jgi:hypothetical protein